MRALSLAWRVSAAAFGCALSLAGCTFPAALTCATEFDCRQGAVCDPETARCVAGPETGTSPDATAMDALVADLGPTDALCASLCPSGTPCSGRVEIANASFEADDESWTYLSPAHRTHVSVDGESPADGEWMTELRIDWALVEHRNFSRVEQFLPMPILPVGHYRLCFSWRVATGLENCHLATVPDHSLLLLEADPADPAAPALVVTPWTLPASEWCPLTTLGSDFQATAWQAACVEFEREIPWAEPAIGFLARTDGVLDARRTHAFQVDDIRLQLLECVTP